VIWPNIPIGLHIVVQSPLSSQHLYRVIAVVCLPVRVVRWPQANRERAALKPFTPMSKNWTYDFSEEKESPKGWNKAIQLCGYNSHFLTQNWRAFIRECQALECDPGLYR
jgi:hypothetical protein